MTNKNIRVRIAPSPSGNLHVGTARTALFNYLFAKKHDGKFILRIEDTDLERSEEKYIQNIYESLKAMRLNWDEGPDVGGKFGPYKQSERFDIYKKYAHKLLDEGKAYYCYCTQEELEAEKEKGMKSESNYVHTDKCTNISPEQEEKYKSEGRVPTIKFKMPSKKVVIKDLVKGDVEFDTSLISDFVILKSNGTPTYNFAVVVDDMDMQISHIIRGEDHISNTPRQIAVYKALGAELPKFAHVGMILAPDKSKLSKRHGATAVSEFIQQGYLTEAFVNFIALLGWTPSDGEEIKPLDKIIEAFSLEGISPSNSIFEFDKLNWMNGQYIRSMDISEITERIKPYIKGYDLSEYTEEKLKQVIDAIREKISLLSDSKEATEYFFGNNVNYDEKSQEILADEVSKTVLSKFNKIAEDIQYDDLENIHDVLGNLRSSFKEQGIKPKQTMWAIRAAVTGRLQGADISQTISILGKEKVKYRTQQALKQ